MSKYEFAHKQVRWRCFDRPANVMYLRQIVRTLPVRTCLQRVCRAEVTLRRALSPPQRPLCSKGVEVSSAEEAVRTRGSAAATIFSRVIDRSVPADIIHEDEKVNTCRTMRH